MNAPDDASLTQLLARASQGERAALDRVFALLYPELRRIARARLRTQGGTDALDTTSLVHESFLRMVEASQLVLSDRKHFFAYAAKAMRNIIIDFAREQLAQRRGGGQPELRLDTALANALSDDAGHATLVRVNDVLLQLEAVDAALAQVVEMRFFAGYSDAEVAELLGSSERTVRRQWDKARAFLLAALRDD